MKREHLATINPNMIRTRVNLRNDTLAHSNKKKEKERKKCRDFKKKKFS